MDAVALSNDELVDEVLTWAARIARGEARHLELIAELDEREAWAGHGVTSCAHWLSWKLGWSRGTARERCRVGRALRSLPLIREAFGAGRLSYSQVRAVTRVATVQDEQKWLDLARCSTGAQLDAAATGAQRARAAARDPRERPPKQASRVEWDDDGDLVLTLRIPAHQSVAVLAALEQHQAAEQAEREERIKELLAQALPAPAPASASASVSASVSASASAEAHQLTLPEPRAAADDADRAPAEAPGPTFPEPRVAADQATDLAGDASAEAGEGTGDVDLTAVPEARWLSPLEPFPYVEPTYPIHPDRMFAPPTEAERAALTAWTRQRDQARAVRDAWNTRREQLLEVAAAQRVPTGKATLTDALVRLITRPTECAPVTVQLLVDPLSSWARTQRDELLPPATVEKLLHELPLRGRGAVPPQLCQYDQGRTSRLISPRLRRLLGQLDGERCRFPGCSHTRNLHAHHLLFWQDGGATDLGNLVLLCGRHHRLLHQAGYVLALNADRTLHVHCPDGTRLEHHPTLPDASAEALPPAEGFASDYRGDSFDVGYVVNVMLAHAA